MALTFKKAKRSLAKLRLAIQGPSGSGKTFGALLLAKGLGGRIAVVDTERSSASLYADLPGMPEFDTLDLDPPYTPERYVEAIRAAENAGYDVLIIDSMTHEWSGQGGCLELVDQIAKTRFKGNTWSAWSEITPRHRKFVDAMIGSRCHIIATMRSKTDTVQEENDRGRKTVRKVGVKAEQRDGMDYEFTVVFDLENDTHHATASKDRTAMFSDPVRISEDVGACIASWLSSAQTEPATKPYPVPPPISPADADLEDASIYETLAEKLHAAETYEQLNEVAQQIAAAGVSGDNRDKLLGIYREKKNFFLSMAAMAAPQ